MTSTKKRIAVNILFLTLAGIVNATGVTLFLVPWKLLDGGLSGTSFLLGQLTKVPLAVWLIILNFPFFLFSTCFALFFYVFYSKKDFNLKFYDIITMVDFQCGRIRKAVILAVVCLRGIAPSPPKITDTQRGVRYFYRNV